IASLTIDRLADTQVIDVRRHDDELVAQRSVSTAQNASDVLRLDCAALDLYGGFHARRQRKTRQRLSCIGQSEQLLERVARTDEELVGVCGIDGRAKLLPWRFVERRVRE